MQIDFLLPFFFKMRISSSGPVFSHGNNKLELNNARSLWKAMLSSVCLGFCHFQSGPSDQLCSCSLPAWPCRRFIAASVPSPGFIVVVLGSAEDVNARLQDGAGFLFVGFSPRPWLWALLSQLGETWLGVRNGNDEWQEDRKKVEGCEI